MIETSYRVEVDENEQGMRDCLDFDCSSKRAALAKLKKWRRRFPKAYIVRCVATRARGLRGVQIIRQKRLSI